MSSPHGWTSWKTYATWYLYQLTGEEHYLRETMDTLGACVQLIDAQSGRLRWAFVPDPYVCARAWQPDPDRPGQGVYQEKVIGEQYIEMLSGWWKAWPGEAVNGYINSRIITAHAPGVDPNDNRGACCDNDVHETFKCLEEVALTSAYVLERPDGRIVTWNCTARR